MILRTFADSKEFENYPVDETGYGWAQAVIAVIREMDKNAKR